MNDEEKQEPGYKLNILEIFSKLAKINEPTTTYHTEEEWARLGLIFLKRQAIGIRKSKGVISTDGLENMLQKWGLFGNEEEKTRLLELLTRKEITIDRYSLTIAPVEDRSGNKGYRISRDM